MQRHFTPQFVLTLAVMLISTACAPTLASGTVGSSAKPAPKPVRFQVYKSYFESNASALPGANSYLAFSTQTAFDKIFGSAAVMGKNDFLSAKTFQTKTVVAAIKRGSKRWNYAVKQVITTNHVLYIHYNATSSSGGNATYASPLIIAADRGSFRSVVFIENGQQVGSARIALQTASTHSINSGQVRVFLVAVGDQGQKGKKFGCDDSLVPVVRTMASTSTPLKFALHSLLSLPAQPVGYSGLQNFWKGRNLSLQSVNLEGGVATIIINGDVFVAGICDQPRIIEQIEATARQFPAVKKVRVFMGRRSLAEAIE